MEYLRSLPVLAQIGAIIPALLLGFVVVKFVYGMVWGLYILVTKGQDELNRILEKGIRKSLDGDPRLVATHQRV